jgi:hypothetical protein
MKVFFTFLFAAMIQVNVFAQETNLFMGQWNFFAANVISIIETNGRGTWTRKSCIAEEYIQTKSCVNPHVESEVELYVYDQELKGLCSVTAKDYCWNLLYVIPGRTSQLDTIVIKADPYNREPGLGFAISANRLN